MTPTQAACPAGLVEPGEDPLATAQREIVEETGITPDRFAPIGRFMLMQGCCDELMFLYVARAALPAPGAAGTHGLAAEGEDVRVPLVFADAAFAMLEDERTAMTALYLMWLRHRRARLRGTGFNWRGGTGAVR